MAKNRESHEARKGEEIPQDAAESHDQDSEPPRTAVPPKSESDEMLEWGRDDGC